MLQATIWRARTYPSGDADHMPDCRTICQCDLDAASAGDSTLPGLKAHIVDIRAEYHLLTGGHPLQFYHASRLIANRQGFIAATALSWFACVHDVATAERVLAEMKVHSIRALHRFASRLLKVGHHGLCNQIQTLDSLESLKCGYGLTQQNGHDGQADGQFDQAEACAG